MGGGQLGKSNKRWLIVQVIFLALLVIMGTSYALWQMTFRQSSTNRVNTNCFKVEFNDKNPITLGDAYPLSDTDGEELVPYEFTITNICSEHARYEVNLEVLDETTLMNHSYIKTMYNDGTPKILTNYDKVEKTLNNATDSYNLEVGYLGTNESKTINLRLWLSDDTPLSEDTMNKIFSSKVTVTTSYAKKTPGTLRTISSGDTTGMWEYKGNITKLVIQNKLNKINGAVKVSDESLSQDESIMSYVVPNEDGETYTVYLQGQDIIYLNSSSSCLFKDFYKLETIEGIRYLDTSKVTYMSDMFYNCQSLKSLDLSNFDTSQVTSMRGMFWGCDSLTSLDISNFNTSKVTNMYYMFHGCKSLTSIDVSSFDTSSVTDMGSMFRDCNHLTSLELTGFSTVNVTNMRLMFAECKSLVTLNLNSFDTSKVTDIVQMFANCSNLESLDISATFTTSQVSDLNGVFSGCSSLTVLDLSSFNTSKVTTMEDMFKNCSGLTSLDISGFDTSNVTSMDEMFSGCGGLTNLDLSSFNTSKVTNMWWMFINCTGLKTIVYSSNFVHVNTANVGAMFRNCPANKPTHSSWNGVTF